MKYRSLILAILALFVASTAFSQGKVITVLTLSGEIDAVSARYILRGLDRAERDGSALAVIELNTPGGLETSMDQIVTRILASTVPVAVYVWPEGGRAASAGVFVAMAAQITAMTPGTHIGAAHPVDSSGADITGVMGEKVLNDSVALLRSLAEQRGRSTSWADDAVRRSMSLTDSEAAAQHVSDLTAGSLGELLTAVDGRTVTTPSGRVVLHTVGVEVRSFRMTIIDWVLGFLVNPDLAYILLVIGIFGVIFELTSPGAIAPGVAGALALTLAFVGFGSLPTNIGGIVFILLAVVLFIVDIKAPTHGFLTAGGVVSFVLGSLLLFPSWRAPAAPSATGLPIAANVHISLITIIIMTLLVVAFFTFVLGKGIGAMTRAISFGAETIVGGAAVALTECAPEGLVRMGGEQWTARVAEGVVHAGDPVEVVGRDGLRLLVRATGRVGAHV